MNNIPAPRASVVAQLIAESEELEERMASLQEGEEPRPKDVGSVRADYRAWHSRASRVLPPDIRKKFDEQRNGSLVKPGIDRFLSEPRTESVLKAPDGSFPLGQRWQYSFNNVRSRLEKQRSLLADAEPEESPAALVAADLANVLRRLPDFIHVLQQRRPDWPIGEAFKDERELQVLVEALLRTLFDDVRPEDYTPSRGGANSRVDFVLPEVGVIVETKMTRESMSAKKLGEELLVDAGRYPAHPNCEAIVAYVYDPDKRLQNPRGIERDLTQTTGTGISFFCVIS
ncbi:hypothetical protein ACFVYC_18610 [Pseudarthrobacter sp. NPDC058329]|uniref:PD-(D/E)XK nuclease domain-containing protein n=1 Tax=Pseudarthrobacter sp. NPDC058329 TaxID=3346448 RepID=UPI0036DD1504